MRTAGVRPLTTSSFCRSNGPAGRERATDREFSVSERHRVVKPQLDGPTVGAGATGSQEEHR